jgi:heme-degrading monooxygenase HmoA
MFARLVSAKAKKGKLDEVIRVWEEEDIPLMDSVKGYRGAYLLTDRRTGRGKGKAIAPLVPQVVSITLWDIEEDSIADEQSQLHHAQLDMYEDLLTGTPIHQGYEIVAKDKV